MSKVITAVLAVLVTGLARAQEVPDYQTDFPPEEFKARWAKVFDRIGDKAVAVVSERSLATCSPRTDGVLGPLPSLAGRTPPGVVTHALSG